MVNVKDIIKPLGSQGFLIGIGVAALAYFLAPQLKQSMRPVAVKGTQGVMALGSKTKQFFEDSKDKLANMLSDKPEGAEVTENKLKDFFEQAELSSKVLKDLYEEREASNKIMQELRDSILNLKEEISQLNHGKHHHAQET